MLLDYIGALVAEGADDTLWLQGLSMWPYLVHGMHVLAHLAPPVLAPLQDILPLAIVVEEFRVGPDACPSSSPSMGYSKQIGITLLIQKLALVLYLHDALVAVLVIYLHGLIICMVSC